MRNKPIIKTNTLSLILNNILRILRILISFKQQSIVVVSLRNELRIKPSEH